MHERILPVSLPALRESSNDIRKRFSLAWTNNFLVLLRERKKTDSFHWCLKYFLLIENDAYLHLTRERCNRRAFFIVPCKQWRMNDNFFLFRAMKSRKVSCERSTYQGWRTLVLQMNDFFSYVFRIDRLWQVCIIFSFHTIELSTTAKKKKRQNVIE